MILDPEATYNEYRKRFPRKREHYDFAAHWFWQTCPDIHIWTPELYQSISFPITVTRILRVGDVERWMKQEDETNDLMSSLKKSLHFDFEIETRIRELGHCINFFKRSSEPVDIRAKSDTGVPPHSELFAFCLFCDPKEIKYHKAEDSPSWDWPKHDTLNMQKSAIIYVREVSTP